MRWPAPRSARWRSAARRWRPTCPSRPPSSAGVRLERLLHRRPCRLRPRFFDRGALRSAGGLDQQRLQRRDRRRTGRLQCSAAVRPAARRRSRPDVSELLHLEHDRLHADRRALRGRRAARTMSAPCAAASATPAGTGWFMPPAASPLPASASSIRPTSATDQKHINVRPGWAAGAGVEYAFAPHWSAKLEYLYSQFDRANIRFPSGAEYTSTLDFQQIRIGLNRKVDWPGSNSRDPEVRPDRSRIRSLGNPRPDHLSGTGLSGIPRALYRHQQPDARRDRRRQPGATAFI